MARQIGGNDNVMGSKEAVVNVSFKDDLGNILENASQLKEVLDQVNQNFLAINSVIGLTTGSMQRLSSQTQRLVSTTQQLRSEYQLIADASQRIGISGSLSLPTSGAFSADSDVVREALTGTGRAAGLILGGGKEELTMGRTAGLQELQVGKYTRGQRPRPGVSASDRYFRAYLGDANLKEKDVTTAIGLKLTSSKKDYSDLMPGKVGFGGMASEAFKDYQSGASITSIVSSAGKALKSASEAGLLGEGLFAKLAPGIGNFMAAAPFITGSLLAGAAVYKAFDYLNKGATRYTGLTGGTGIFENTGAASGSKSFLGLQRDAWISGLLNMGVGVGGYTAIQEGLLGAGYTARSNQNYNQLGIRGMRYESTRSALADLYKKGLQNVDQNLQLMQLVTERGNGSLVTLTGTIDNLRTTALTTNASLKLMIETMSASIQSLVGRMGMSGNVAAFVGGTNAAAYANARNTLLRGSGAPDYGNFAMQMMMMQSQAYQGAGINFQNMYYMAAHPELNSQGLGLTTAQATDQSTDKILGMMFGSKIKPGMSYQATADAIRLAGPGPIQAAMQFAAQTGLVKDPNITSNVDAFIDWAATNLTSDPQTASAEKSQKQNMGKDINVDVWAKKYKKENPNATAAEVQAAAVQNYLAQTKIGGATLLDRSTYDRSQGPYGTSWLESHPVASDYIDYVRATGDKVGWIEKVLNQKHEAGTGTWVKVGDQTMTLADFMEKAKTDPTLQAALRGEGPNRVMVGEKGSKESIDEITWTDSAEYGGGGAAAKAMTEMTADDFADSIQKGLLRFNNHVPQGLRVQNV